MQVETNEYGIIVDAEQVSGRELFLRCRERQVSVPDQLTAVLRKGGLHRKRTKEIGDGMEVLLGYERDAYEVLLEKERLLRGLWIRQEFDEEAGIQKTYLYKFPKDQQQIDALNVLLSSWNMEVRAIQEWRFVVLTDATDTGTYTCSSLNLRIEELKTARYSQLVSLLCGCMLGYGSYELVHDGSHLRRCMIYLPLVWQIGRYEELLSAMVDAFAWYGVFLQVDLLPSKVWHTRQMSCKDREVLYALNRRMALWYTNLNGNVPAQLFEQEYLWIPRDLLPEAFSSYSVLKKRIK